MENKNPFLGPKSYEDGDKFFGRNTEIKEVANLIRNETLTLFFSRSGTGKSSLIKAGLIPYLKDYDYLPIYIHLSDSGVNENSSTNLCDYIIKRCNEEINKQLSNKKEIKITVPELQYRHSLFEFIINLRLTLITDSETEYEIKPVLIFDQFEEIFTHPFLQSDMEAFISDLRCLIESQIPGYMSDISQAALIKIQSSLISKQKNYKILFSFREEYLPQFESLRKEIPFIGFTNSRLRLEAFSEETASGVIVATDNQIADNVAQKIAENLAVSIQKNFDKIVVEPFLLSLVCQRIYPEIILENSEANEGLIDNLKDMVGNSIDKYIDEIYLTINDCTKEFIETKLITSDHKRTPFNYNEAIANNLIKDDLIRLIDTQESRILNKEQFLDSQHIEILHDRLLPPLAKRRDTRIAKNERDALIKLELAGRKKRRLITLYTIIVLLIITGFFTFYIIKQKRDMEQLALLISVNQFFEENDLRKAFGVYPKMQSKNVGFIKNMIDDKSKKLSYTDLPGTSNISLSNSHIVATFNSKKTIEIWEVISPEKIRLSKSYKNISLHAVSADGNYLAISDGKGLIVYNSKTDRDTVLIKGSEDDVYFSFSQNDYLYFHSKSKSYAFNLNNRMQRWPINIKEEYRIALDDILLASENKVYSTFNSATSTYNYLIKWTKSNDTLYLNSAWNSRNVPWCYMQNDSVVLITPEGLEIRNLITEKQTLLVKGNFSKFKSVTKISEKEVFLSTNTDSRDYKYTAVGFFFIDERKVYEPSPKSVIDKISISTNWSKCLMRINGNRVVLWNNKAKTLSKLNLPLDSIYDISDDERYLLYVNETKKEAEFYDDIDASPVLYLYDFKSDKNTLIDSLSIDPENSAESSLSIYGKYSFHFNNNSDLIAYLKKGKNGTSNLVVKRLADTSVIFISSTQQKYLNDYRHADFTSNYIHVKNIDTLKGNGINKNRSSYVDREGVKLLTNKKRDARYYLNLYKEIKDKEWGEELKKTKDRY